MTRLAFFILTLSYCSANGQTQSIAGIYDSENESVTNKRHYEELRVNADHTFEYRLRQEFLRISKVGTWIKNGDTIQLMEADSCCKDKMSVVEQYDPKLSKFQRLFSVSSFDGEPLDYHLELIQDGQVNTIWSLFGSSTIERKSICEFRFIIGSYFYSPIYKVKDKKTNRFNVQLLKERKF